MPKHNPAIIAWWLAARESWGGVGQLIGATVMLYLSPLKTSFRATSTLTTG